MKKTKRCLFVAQKHLTKPEQISERGATFVYETCFCINNFYILYGTYCVSMMAMMEIWDASHFRCLQVLEQHTRYVTCCAFTRDSKWFVTGFENVVNVWKLSGSINGKDGKMVDKTDPVMEWGVNHVTEWLLASGLKKYAKNFKEAKITGKILLSLNENGLKELSIDEESCPKILEKIQWARFGHSAPPPSHAKDEDDIPTEFLCPITHDIMVDPVTCDDGFVYEAAAIKEWLISRKQTSPMTNLPLKNSKLGPHLELKKKISDFLKIC